MPQVFENVACTLCGCVCDDLRLTVDAARITRAEGACHLAEPWFLHQHESRPPAAAVDGTEVPWTTAIERAAALLADARLPLIYGLSRSSTEGQRAAVALGDQIGAVVDTTASMCHAPSIVALQSVGESTCSLGEIRNRADLVLFWGCDPLVTHPRHLERYSVEPRGQFLPRGRADRTVVVIDSDDNQTAPRADLVLRLGPERDFEALWALRALIRGDSVATHHNLGAPLETLRDLAARMKACRTGVIFFGLGLSRRGLGHLNVEALLRLVTELNDHTRFYARRMRVQGDVTGADSVLCWQTGYPFSVDLARGFPRYNPGEFSANDLLERGDVDACLFVGSEGVAQFSDRARATLARLPVITLDYPPIPSSVEPTVRFTTAIYGLHRPGTAYRMDEIPIPLRPLLATDYPDDAEVLTAIASHLPRRSSP